MAGLFAAASQDHDGGLLAGGSLKVLGEAQLVVASSAR
jgi:hypothetical protein